MRFLTHIKSHIIKQNKASYFDIIKRYVLITLSTKAFKHNYILEDQFIEKSAFPETISFSGPFSRRLNSQKAVKNVSTRFQAKFEIWKSCDQRLHNFCIFGMHWSRGWSRIHKRAEDHRNLDEFHFLNFKSLIFFVENHEKASFIESAWCWGAPSLLSGASVEVRHKNRNPTHGVFLRVENFQAGSPGSLPSPDPKLMGHN